MQVHWHHNCLPAASILDLDLKSAGYPWNESVLMSMSMSVVVALSVRSSSQEMRPLAVYARVVPEESLASISVCPPSETRSEIERSPSRPPFDPVVPNGLPFELRRCWIKMQAAGYDDLSFGVAFVPEADFDRETEGLKGYGS